MQPRRNNNQSSGVGMMIQKCHKYRQRRKQVLDQARQTSDAIERERLLQMAEHFGRFVSTEQGKIDNTRGGPAEKFFPSESDAPNDGGDEDSEFPEFIIGNQ